MKKLILIASLLIVGCSQEQDTRLICDCIYETKNNGAKSKDLKGEKLPCEYYPYAKSDLSVRPVVFNQSQNKFCTGEDGCSHVENKFTDESITKSYGDGKANDVIFSLNRISLIFTIIDWEKVRDWENDRDLYNNTSKVYQCKVVDGV